MLISENGRLIWDEYYNTSMYDTSDAALTCIDPCISFDNGYSWMSFLNIASTLRSNGTSTNNNTKISASTNNIGFNQLNINFSFTPYSVSEIVDIEYEAASDGVFTGGTTYYFTVMNLTYDLPGYYNDDADTAGNNYLYYTGNYYNGKTYGTLSNGIDIATYYPMSHIKSITLPSSSSKYNIHLYIKYPKMSCGLCVYSGTISGTTITFNLNHVTNLVQALGADLAVNQIDRLVLENNYPLPSKGTVVVDSERITYNGCSYVTGITRTNANGTSETVSRWCLLNLTRTTNVAHYWKPNATASLVRVYLALYEGGNYGEKPAAIYPKISLDSNCVQYIKFDSKNVNDLATHISSGNSIVNTTPTVVGTVAYDTIVMTMINSLRLTGYGVVLTDIKDLANITYTESTAFSNYYAYLNNKGSIHFYMQLSEFVSSSSSDPYIFYPYNNEEGLWMRINKFNLKPYFGFRYESNGLYYNIEITNPEDYRLPSLTMGEYSSYCITWETITKTNKTDSSSNSNLNLMRFTYIVNGVKILSFDSSIISSNFEIGNLCLGGSVLSGNTIVADSTFVGYMDDWRVYAGKVLTYEDSMSINKSNNLISNDNCGKITLDSTTYINYNNANISGTNTNSLSESVAATSPTNSDRIRKYEPRLYTTIKATATAGRDYGTDYDDWFINAYTSDGKIPSISPSTLSSYSSKNITYPISTDTIKLKFDMTGPGDGFSSPKVKNIMFITSEGSLD